MILQAGFLFRVFGNESISPPVLSMSFQLPVWFVYVLLVSWKVTSTWLIFLGRFVPPKKSGTKMMGILTDSRFFLFTPHLHSKSFGSTHTSFTFRPEILEMLEMLFRTWNYRKILLAFPGIANANSDWSGRASYGTKTTYNLSLWSWSKGKSWFFFNP